MSLRAKDNRVLALHKDVLKLLGSPISRDM